MVRSWTTIPHVTQFEEATMDQLIALRGYLTPEFKQEGIRLTYLTFLIKALVHCLIKFPRLNSSLSGDGTTLTTKHYYHIAIAVDTEQGLVVPVIRDADKKNFKELSAELMNISERARNRKLTKNDMQGASCTISSLGGIGGRFFTPIINPPEVAIIGVSKAYQKLQLTDNTLTNVTALPFSLSYDHRVIDGALAARATAYLASLIEEPWLFVDGSDKNNALKKYFKGVFPAATPIKAKKPTTKRASTIKAKKPVAKRASPVKAKPAKKTKKPAAKRAPKKKIVKKTTAAKRKR